MAICSACKQEMKTATGCKRLPINKLPQVANNHEKCHDCGAHPGKFHHPGCDMERCPRCYGQLISCGCR